MSEFVGKDPTLINVGECIPITFHGVCQKYSKRMTSKKYKKWLMSIGMMRNDADILCYIIGSLKGKVSYADVYGINHGLLLISGESPTFLDILQSIIIKGDI